MIPVRVRDQRARHRLPGIDEEVAGSAVEPIGSLRQHVSCSHGPFYRRCPAKVVVELKTVEELAPIHEAQVLTYLKLTGAPLGLLLNFNVTVLRNGIRRLLNKQHEIVDDFDPVEKKRLNENGTDYENGTD
ncbi:MAG TPA: GxxExxY protein [Vicinamibacterales bacterium]|nr:GxxExxY protein [Vicinamibacterales bacterium]